MGNPKRRSSNKDDDEHFSDDSLEESLPPPPPALATPSKRNSIAWEVSLDVDDPLLTPGSTKVKLKFLECFATVFVACATYIIFN